MGYLTKYFYVLSVGFLVAAASAKNELPIGFQKLKAKGDFKAAAAMLHQALKKPGLSVEKKQAIEWQIEQMERIRQDYPFTEDQLFQALAKSVNGLTKEEFAAWLKESRFDYLMIDGEKRFVGTSVSNLFWRHADLEARRQPAKEVAAYHRSLLETARRVKRTALQEGKPLVLPTHLRCTMTVTVEKNVADGELIRAWLPVPRSYPFQKDFNLLGTSSDVKYLSHEESPIRSIYLEQREIKQEPTKFEVKYEFVRNGIYFNLKPEAVRKESLDDDLKRFTQEAPHVVFTSKIRELAYDIAGEQQNPLLQARAFYNWIADNIKYSYAREYSTLTNISDYCASNGYGDCGQEGLLFITLCRSRGIPARWQSGWNLFPGHVGIHDWTEIYLAPYGWIPVDPWAGIYAARYCTNLTKEERTELRDFYFGGLDQYRMSANCDHNQQLQPPKKNFRSDNVDFQRGELEAKHNLYFDKYNYRLQVEELPVGQVSQ